mmetsp:Transcript_13204/g.19891  ORF Transcript_13204/g.19891 Transcript_13204/m.19891 type:complete len:212 (+) Transcript_13204:614-1249(+)
MIVAKGYPRALAVPRQDNILLECLAVEGVEIVSHERHRGVHRTVAATRFDSGAVVVMQDILHRTIVIRAIVFIIHRFSFDSEMFSNVAAQVVGRNIRHPLLVQSPVHWHTGHYEEELGPRASTLLEHVPLHIGQISNKLTNVIHFSRVCVPRTLCSRIASKWHPDYHQILGEGGVAVNFRRRRLDFLYILFGIRSTSSRVFKWNLVIASAR